MTTLAIGVTIDPSSARPETARFIYAYDPTQPSPPYLDNAKGDITLPGGKVAVTIQYRLMQAEVTLANHQTYALSLPPTKGLQIKGPSPGQWPQQFSHPAQSGKPGKPPTVVVVTDQNGDSKSYKYSLSVVFTPQAGATVTAIDDPKIRNGGDSRANDWLIVAALVGVLLIVGIVAIRWTRSRTKARQ